eukprot:6187119-Pleurochrysis_carterae.AAC.1
MYRFAQLLFAGRARRVGCSEGAGHPRGSPAARDAEPAARVARREGGALHGALCSALANAAPPPPSATN